MTIRSAIIGCGAYLPEKIMTNDDLAKMVETSDEWISKRTGIKARHVAAEDETTSDMAIKAATEALDKAGISGADIDAVFVATTTPDHTFPATAVQVQAAIGMEDRGFAMDLQAVCSGFVYGLATADNFIKVGQVKRALVIGAEKFTKLLDWEDRGTCVLFGDGAGAVVLEAQEDDIGGIEGRGIISTHLHSDGRQKDILYANGGPGTTGQAGVVVMNGKEVFRHAVHRMSEVVNESLEENNITPSDIDWLVPHQANQRIIDSTAQKLGLDENRIILTVSKHGNTSAASIPLALYEGIEDGRIKPGNLVLMEALGGGLTWGAALIRM